MVARAWLTTMVLVLFAAPSHGTTVDALFFQGFPSEEISFDSLSGELRFVFFPDRILLSNGDIVPRGAGSTNGSNPTLAEVSSDGSLNLFLFSPDPYRPLTRFGSTIEGGFPGFQIQLDFLSLRIEGETGQSTGQLIASALLASDDLGLHATAPVGSVIPITATATLLDGAVFGPTLTQSDFTLNLDGIINLAVPEPSTCLLLGIGVAGLSLRARKRCTASVERVRLLRTEPERELTAQRFALPPGRPRAARRVPASAGRR